MGAGLGSPGSDRDTPFVSPRPGWALGSPQVPRILSPEAPAPFACSLAHRACSRHGF